MQRPDRAQRPLQAPPAVVLAKQGSALCPGARIESSVRLGLSPDFMETQRAPVLSCRVSCGVRRCRATEGHRRIWGVRVIAASRKPPPPRAPPLWERIPAHTRKRVNFPGKRTWLAHQESTHCAPTCTFATLRRFEVPAPCRAQFRPGASQAAGSWRVMIIKLYSQEAGPGQLETWVTQNLSTSTALLQDAGHHTNQGSPNCGPHSTAPAPATWA
jgi:hypothetical protein